MAKRIVTIVLSVILVVAIVLAVIPATRNAIGGWFTSIFSSESKTGDDTTVPTEDSNTTAPTEDESSAPTEGESESTTPTEGEEPGEILIDDMSQEQRVQFVLKKLDEIAAREASDNEYTLEEAFMMTMHIVVADGKVVESGHNMPAPGVETYSMDTFPGGWNWAEVDDQMIHTLLFVSGDNLSVVQNQVTANTEYVAAADESFQIAGCKHGNALVSGYFVRTRGDLTIVNFDAQSYASLKSVFRWWYEIDANGQQIVKVGFDYCNDAPEGAEGVIPIFLPSLSKGK